MDGSVGDGPLVVALSGLTEPLVVEPAVLGVETEERELDVGGRGNELAVPVHDDAVDKYRLTSMHLRRARGEADVVALRMERHRRLAHGRPPAAGLEHGDAGDEPTRPDEASCERRRAGHLRVAVG